MTKECILCNAKDQSDMIFQCGGGWLCSACSKIKSDAVNHPPHYQSGKMEVIEVIEAFRLDFCLGNAIKYILRAGKKGCTTTDLKKASWYITRAIEKVNEKGPNE